MRRTLGVLLVLALTACSAPNPPLTKPQLREIVQTIDDDNWSEVDYPEATRPDFKPGRTLADSDWSADAELCLNNSGFQVKQEGFEFKYSSGLGQRLIDFVTARYRCTSEHPRLGELTGYLDEGQRVELLGYYERMVFPCLRLAGLRPAALPSQIEFVDDASFDPYSNIPVIGAKRHLLLEKCPPVPGWLTP